MKILFLSHYFPPEVNAPATRTYEHCKAWVEAGHEVTVVSCVPHHPMGEAYPGYRNRFFQRETVDGIEAIKVLTYITANEGFAKRTFNYIFYMLMVIVCSPFIRKADVVISTSPQFFNGLAGYFVSRIKRAPWVLEIRDLWPESIVAVGAAKSKRLISLLEMIERFVYRKADHIVPVTNSFKEHISERGGKLDAITVIRNGVDLDSFKPQSSNEQALELKRELGLEGKFVAAYVGTHGMAHGLDTIMDAAAILEGDERIRFLMVGDGSERERLLQKKNERRLDNVVMLGQQPKAKMPEIWAISDVSLVLLRKLDLFKTVIPSKIFESMAMSTPIVLGVEGEVAQIIEESGSGLCIEPESAAELAKKLRQLTGDDELYQRLAISGRAFVACHYSRQKLAIHYLENILETVVNKGKS